MGIKKLKLRRPTIRAYTHAVQKPGTRCPPHPTRPFRHAQPKKVYNRSTVVIFSRVHRRVADGTTGHVFVYENKNRFVTRYDKDC